MRKPRMFIADEPLKQVQQYLSSKWSHPHRYLQWAFIDREFEVVPVFGDLQSELSRLITGFYEIGYQRLLIDIRAELPSEGKAFSHLSYDVNALKEDSQGCGFDTDSNETMLRRMSDLFKSTNEKIACSIPSAEVFCTISITAPVSEILFIDAQLCVDERELEMKLPDGVFRNNIVDLFLSEAPKRFSSLCQAISQKNNKEIHRIAHSMKGSALNVSAQRLAYFCRRLEMVSKIGHTEQTSQLQTKIEAELCHVLKQLDQYLQR